MATSFGFLSTHPPTQCGLATFNAALVTHLAADRKYGVVRVTDEPDVGTPGPEVIHTWLAHDIGGWRGAAAALNAFDVAVIQHEYGIYPGADGEDVLPVLRALTVPSIVVLHTVLTNPRPAQQELLEHIVGAAGGVVTMTVAAHDKLIANYDVDPAKVTVIPHGAADHTGTASGTGHRPHLLTWGLIGPGKGIEWAVHALAYLTDLDPQPLYTVAGKTHPKVLEQQGESYRATLERLGTALGVAENVRYEAVYRDAESLSELIRSADVVVLPYDSREQVTSGVLIEAVAAGVPVVATPFPHAVELLTDGPGLLVPHGDPEAIAAAVRRILSEPGFAATLADRSQQPSMLWPTVADCYDALGQRLLASHRSVLAPA